MIGLFLLLAEDKGPKPARRTTNGEEHDHRAWYALPQVPLPSVRQRGGAPAGVGSGYGGSVTDSKSKLELTVFLGEFVPSNGGFDQKLFNSTSSTSLSIAKYQE